MKKPNTRTVLLSLALVASLSAYVFLSNASTRLNGSVEPTEVMHYEERAEAESPAVVLPDIMLLKKAVEVGKRFLPATSI